MTDLETTRLAMAEFGRVVTAFRREMDVGVTVSLEGLPEATRSLCERIASLPRDEGKALLPRLAALVREVDALGEKMRSVHGALRESVTRLQGQLAE